MPTWQTLTHPEVVENKAQLPVEKKNGTEIIDLKSIVKEIEIAVESTHALVSSTYEHAVSIKCFIAPVLKTFFSPWTEKPAKKYPKSEKVLPKWDPNPPISTSDYPANNVNVQSRPVISISEFKQHFHDIPSGNFGAHKVNSLIISTYSIYH
jgi:hypothetical protein